MRSFNPLFTTYKQGLNQLTRSIGSPFFLQEVIQNELLGIGESVESHLSCVLAILGVMKNLNVRTSTRRTQEDTRNEQLGLDGAAEGFLQQVLKWRGISLPAVFPQASQENVKSTPSLKLNIKLKP